jgi:hypothetical protein
VLNEPEPEWKVVAHKRKKDRRSKEKEGNAADICHFCGNWESIQTNTVDQIEISSFTCRCRIAISLMQHQEIG